jgi:Fic family protein
MREIHARLMEGVRGGNATPGEFRRSQNWIGPAGSTLADAPYVPPPADEMMDCLARWELFLQVITLFLIERGRLSQPLLYLSAYIEAR